MTISDGSLRKYMSIYFTRNVKTDKILKISRVRCHFVKFDIYFLGLP